MPDYSKGKIYKIVCNTTCLIYIGSTCEPTLAKRLAKHRGDYKVFLNGKRKYGIKSFDILENNNYEIILIENCDCLCKDELHSRERHFIESMECTNKVIPTRTDKEYYNETKTNRLVYQTKYNLEHYADIKDKNTKYYHDNKIKRLEYQKHYNIKPPAGYFGLITRSYINAMLKVGK